MSAYLLPHHPALQSLDPLGICELGEQPISHDALLKELISKADAELIQLEQSDEDEYSRDAKRESESAWIKRFEQLLQDIAYSLHSEHDLDTAGLREAAVWNSTSTAWRRSLRETLFRAALRIVSLYPDGYLPQLGAQQESFSFSPEHMDSILAHMLLGTLQIPTGITWGRPGFTRYYTGSAASVAQNTAPAYLSTILLHFTDGGYATHVNSEHRFTFSYSSALSQPPISESNKVAPGGMQVTYVERPSEPSIKSDAFVLVAANAQPGPGTGGTHEERLVGQSPALALTALLTPKLDPNAAVITSPLPIHTSWQGHGRDAELINFLSTSERPSRRYIIADALPLDLSHKQADLLPGNVEREVRKLFAALNGARVSWSGDGLPLEQLRIEMPPWGCGAFGGSLTVKMPCMMMAAGMAGLKEGNLELLVTRDREREVWKMPGADLTVSELHRLVLQGADNGGRHGIMGIWRKLQKSLT